MPAPRPRPSACGRLRSALNAAIRTWKTAEHAGGVAGSRAGEHRPAVSHAEIAQRQGFTDALLETIEVGIVSCDAHGGFVISNRAERTIFGLDAPLSGQSMQSLQSRIDVFDSSGERLEPEQYPLMRALRGEDVSHVEVRAGPAGGPYRELVVRGRQIVDGRGNVIGAVAALTDVTAERVATRELAAEHHRLLEAQGLLLEAQQQLEHAATHDYLTGLPNRAWLVERLDAALTRSARSGHSMAVIFCDLDGFKAVNDNGGHATGDAVLVEVGRRLAAVVRDEDIVCRVGGDEFVVVVETAERAGEGAGQPHPSPGARTLALDIAARMADALRRPVSINDADYAVTASIGIAHVSSDETDEASRPWTADEVLHRADSAMYRAKVEGKDRVAVDVPHC